MLGPNIIIHNFGYGCTEGLRGKAINLGESGEFILENEGVVEFLDVTNEQTTDNIVQAVCISTFRPSPQAYLFPNWFSIRFLYFTSHATHDP